MVDFTKATDILETEMLSLLHETRKKMGNRISYTVYSCMYIMLTMENAICKFKTMINGLLFQSILLVPGTKSILLSMETLF